MLLTKELARDIETATAIVNQRLEGVTSENIISLDTYNRIFIQSVFKESLLEILHLIDHN